MPLVKSGSGPPPPGSGPPAKFPVAFSGFGFGVSTVESGPSFDGLIDFVGDEPPSADAADACNGINAAATKRTTLLRISLRVFERTTIPPGVLPPTKLNGCVTDLLKRVL